jgi:hypothetical protein
MESEIKVMAMYDTLPADLQPPTRGEKIAEGLRSAAHKVAAIPVLGWFGFGTPLALAAAVVDTIDGFVTKGFTDGLRKGISGTVDTAATATVNGLLQPVNWVVALANPNMDTIPELLRKGTDSVLKNILPEHKQSFPQMDPAVMAAARNNAMFGPAGATAGTAAAGIAYAGGLEQQVGTQVNGNPAPGMPKDYWTDRRAGQLGQDPQQMRENWAKGNTEDLRALHTAARGGQELGAS